MLREPHKATALARVTPDELRARRDELFAPLRGCLDAGFLDLDPRDETSLTSTPVEQAVSSAWTSPRT